MTLLRQTRLAIAVLALGSLGLSTAAKADPIIGRVVGSVAGVLIGKALFHATNKNAHCRLYDSNGVEIFLPCDAKRPIGELMTADRPIAAAPQPYGVAQLDPGDYDPAQQSDCGCRYGGGYAEPAYGPAAYDAYGHGSSAVSYSESAAYSYDERRGSTYGFDGLSGAQQGFYAYGGVDYGAGGYAGYGYGQVAGRDPNGFLTWPGKRPR